MEKLSKSSDKVSNNLEATNLEAVIFKIKKSVALYSKNSEIVFNISYLDLFLVSFFGFFFF